MKSTCRCGAVIRYNYPFGRNSKGRASVIVKHDKDCRYNPDNHPKLRHRKRKPKINKQKIENVTGKHKLERLSA